ncbi:hypothetical protein GDO81_029376 [Engystomops pustulosus]|uniref:Uncharacterized protein n=1 Tax=Engystomops pustulosus TaxID=76066 RepID=A0AAV6YK86_ENGPU|nr:hypothetical protein GDO81_029376 [Engystomops pustulosus]
MSVVGRQDLDKVELEEMFRIGDRSSLGVGNHTVCQSCNDRSLEDLKGEYIFTVPYEALNHIIDTMLTAVINVDYLTWTAAGAPAP